MQRAGEPVQGLLQRPQCAVLMLTSTSQPLRTLPSQSRRSTLLQVATMQVPVTQVAVPRAGPETLAGMAQTDVQSPQLVTRRVERSQPVLCMPSQSA